MLLDLMVLAGEAHDADSFAKAVLFLSSSPIGIFVVEAIFVDPVGKRFLLSEDDLESALTSSSLVHPETGKVIHDVETAVFPVFSVDGNGIKSKVDAIY